MVGAGGRSHLQAAAPGSSSVIGGGSFGSSSAGAQLGGLNGGFGGGFGGALAPFPLSQQSVGCFGSAGNSAAHSRVSSFDMLSVGNPWGDLQRVGRCNLCCAEGVSHIVQWLLRYFAAGSTCIDQQQLLHRCFGEPIRHIGKGC